MYFIAIDITPSQAKHNIYVMDIYSNKYSISYYFYISETN